MKRPLRSHPGPRVRAGTPTGGQFAARRFDEAAVGLGVDPTDMDDPSDSLVAEDPQWAPGPPLFTPGSSEDVMPVDEVLDHYDQWRIRDHRLYEAGDSEAQAVLRSRTSWMVHELASHARYPRPEAKPSKLWKPGDVTDRPTGSDAPSKDELLHEYDQWQLRAEALAEDWRFEEMDELNAEMDHLLGAMYAWHRRAKAAGWS